MKTTKASSPAWGVGVVAVTLAVGACSSSGTSNAAGDAGACDPLAPPVTALAGILGVGKDAQGTLYVADSPPARPQPRVFVSVDGKLVRQHVRGTGQSGGGGGPVEYTLEYQAFGSDAASAQSLLLEVQGGAATQMALGPPGSKSFIGGPGQAPLSVVEPSAATSLAIVNLPNQVEYVADVSDGTAIVVTAPVDTVSSDEFHLFYGAPSAMHERKITSFVQALSGYPTIQFEVGSDSYTMAIGGTQPDGGPPGPGTLSTANGSLPFTVRQPTPTTLSGFSFSCL